MSLIDFNSKYGRNCLNLAYSDDTCLTMKFHYLGYTNVYDLEITKKLP